MPATVTLASTTLAEGCDGAATRLKVTSTSGMYTGLRLFVGGAGNDGELVKVMRLDVDPWVIVTRGVDGSRAQPHVSGDTVYVGRADQFYCCPPMGRPDAAVAVSPYIDVRAGLIYFAQGDTTPSTSANRWWQQQTNTRTSQPLGVLTSTLDPTSST